MQGRTSSSSAATSGLGPLGRLHKIIPAPIIAGRHGTMNPDDNRRMGKLIPHARGHHRGSLGDVRRPERYFREW
jgi:hypothetical protein